MQTNWPDNEFTGPPGKTSSVAVAGVGPLLEGCGVLHHVGFVVRSILSAAEEFAVVMSATWDNAIIHDPLQQVRVAFFHPVDQRNPTFELVEPASDASPVSTFLKKRGGLHHVCYEVDDLDSALRRAQLAGLALACPPTPAAAFNGRRIAWVCFKTFMLMELLERSRK